MYYVSIGSIIMFFIEYSNEKHRNQLEVEGIEVPRFNWFDRLFNIFLWPITVLLFIKNIKDLF
jgi:hypothetical protein